MSLLLWAISWRSDIDFTLYQKWSIIQQPCVSEGTNSSLINFQNGFENKYAKYRFQDSSAGQKNSMSYTSDFDFFSSQVKNVEKETSENNFHNLFSTHGF